MLYYYYYFDSIHECFIEHDECNGWMSKLNILNELIVYPLLFC